jgi:hypothetical protein
MRTVEYRRTERRRRGRARKKRRSEIRRMRWKKQSNCDRKEKEEGKKR